MEKDISLNEMLKLYKIITDENGNSNSASVFRKAIDKYAMFPYSEVDGMKEVRTCKKRKLKF